MSDKNATDLGALLVAAVRGGDAEMCAWYRALAAASPLWSRQQTVYTREWGSQTTEWRGRTAWSVMSYPSELHAPFPSELAWARIILEYIDRTTLEDCGNLAVLQRLLAEQAAANGREVLESEKHARPVFEEDGAITLGEAQSKITGRPARGRKAILDSDTVSAIVKDAESWLLALRSFLNATDAIRQQVRDRMAVALPFLDAVELEYVLGNPPSWGFAAADLLRRRLAAFASEQRRSLSLTRVLEYTFGTKGTEIPKKPYSADHLMPALPKYTPR